MKKLIVIIGLITAMLSLTACSSEKSAGSYYDDGIAALEKGQYEDACRNFEKAIGLKDDKAIYYIEYGQALTKIGDYEKAIEQYEKSIIDVDSSITNKNTKKALRGQGVALYFLGKYEEAVKLFKQALDMDCVNDLNTDIRSYLGQCYVKQDKYKEALGVYDALVKEVGTALVYAQRGSINADAGNLEEAKKDFQKAISLEDKNYSLYLLYYEMLLQAGEEEAAKEILAKGATIKPETTKDSLQLAEVKFYQEDYEGALAILQGIATDIKEAYRLMGDVYYVTKDYNKAIENYLTYIESNSTGVSSTSYLNLSSCYIALEEYDKAQSYVTLGLSAGDKISVKELQYNEVLVYEQLGDFNTAYEKAEEYVKAYPEDENMQRELVFLSTRYNK